MKQHKCYTNYNETNKTYMCTVFVYEAFKQGM